MSSAIAETSRNSIEYVLSVTMDCPSLCEQQDQILRLRRDASERSHAVRSQAASRSGSIQPSRQFMIVQLTRRAHEPACVLQHHADVTPQDCRMMSGMI